MNQLKFKGSQIVAILREADAGLPVTEEFRKNGTAGETNSCFETKLAGWACPV